MLLKLSLPEAAKPGMRAKPVEEQWKFVEMYAASGGAGGFEAADSAALKSVADAPARRRVSATAVESPPRRSAARVSAETRFDRAMDWSSKRRDMDLA